MILFISAILTLWNFMIALKYDKEAESTNQL
jgi:hypothetical protein